MSGEDLVFSVQGSGIALRDPGPPVIKIMATDGTTALATITVTDGKLDVTGPEERWTEAAQRFIAELRCMAWG
jgi:hypothetical protein